MTVTVTVTVKSHRVAAAAALMASAWQAAAAPPGPGNLNLKPGEVKNQASGVTERSIRSLVAFAQDATDQGYYVTRLVTAREWVCCFLGFGLQDHLKALIWQLEGRQT